MRAESLANFRHGKRFGDLAVEQNDDCARRSLRRKHAIPRSGSEILQAGFIERLNVGKLAQPRRRRNAETFDPVSLNKRNGWSHRIHGQLNLSRYEVGQRSAAAFIWNVNELEPGLQPQPLVSEMRHAGEAAAPYRVTGSL